MTLNESAILSVIRDYRSGSCPEDRKGVLSREFRRQTELYIYHFPRMGYRRGPDDCSEFYLYVLERLEPVIRSFPLEDADAGALKFKTWFNAVLRNQFFNFLKYRNRGILAEQSLDGADEENLAVLAFPEQGEDALEGLKQGLSRLDPESRSLLVLYYIPESLDGPAALFLSERSGMPLSAILELQRSMINANGKDIALKRSVAEKIAVVNRKLADLRYRLHRAGRAASDDRHEIPALLARIARWENTRSRLVRSLDRPEGEAFETFRKMFRDRTQAVRSLEAARKKLRWEILSGKSCRTAEAAS